MPARNIELRERVSGGFNHADSLLYPRTHINMVDGLLTDGKLSLSLIPQALKEGLKPVGHMAASGQTTQNLLSMIDDYILNNFGVSGSAARSGCFLIAPLTPTTFTVAVEHICSGDDGEVGINHYTSGTTVTLEANDWVVYRQFANGLHEWYIVNNTHGLATTGMAGLMSSADKSKLDNIASGANNYAHPTQAAIDVNATDNGINVIDRVVVNTLGHVTSVSTRDLLAATASFAGVMSAADKSKLDAIAANANNYVLPAATALALGGVKIGTTLELDVNNILNYNLPVASASVNGGIRVGNRLSISSGILSADVQTDNNFTTLLKNKLDGIAANANNYSHPGGGANVALSLAANEAIASLTVGADGHVTAATKQTIRTGTTAQTGLLQLATGTELTTSLSTAKATAPDAVKSMIDYFAGMKRYADLATANAASHPDGAIALITVV